MKRVILESPFAAGSREILGETQNFSEQDNIDYARRCMHQCLVGGMAPLASHLLYTQENVLDDTNPDERNLGIDAGLAWGHEA